MNSDLQLAFDPEATYRSLVAQSVAPSWARVLARLALVALTFAVIVPIMATHTITIGLVVVSATAWCFVPVVQTAMALVTIAPARGRVVGLARAFELWFAGHLPYTVWLVLLPFIVKVGQLMRLDVVLITFAAAIGWASVVETAYCRVVLGASAPEARRRVAAHQALMLALTAAGVVWAAGGLPGISGFLAREAARLLS